MLSSTVSVSKEENGCVLGTPMYIKHIHKGLATPKINVLNILMFLIKFVLIQLNLVVWALS